MEKETARSTLISLCCEAKIPELREKLALPQFKQLLCAPLKFRDFQNETILHYMCAYTFEEPEVVEVLLDQGADACINNGPITPLSYAAKRNYKDLVRLLLKHGAYPEPAMAYAVNPDILQLLKKKVHDMRRPKDEGSNDASNNVPNSPKLPSQSKQELPKLESPKQEQNKVSLAVSKHITSLFSYLVESTTQTVSDRLAKANSFSEIAAAYQTICEQYKPEGEKATGEFVVSLLLLPWGLPTFARHVAIDHHGQANRIVEVLFSRLPAYKVAVYVESRLANFEKDRPRSSFPHLYVTLVHAVADAIITSLIGTVPSPPTSSEDMVASTMKLLKWVSTVGFVSVSNHAEPTSILKNRILAKTLFLTFRYLSHQPRPAQDSSPPLTTPDNSPFFPPGDFSERVLSPLTISEPPDSPSTPSPTLSPADVILPLLPNIPTPNLGSSPQSTTATQSTTTTTTATQTTIPPEPQSTPNEQPITSQKLSSVRRSITPPPRTTPAPQVPLPPRPITPPAHPPYYKPPHTISESLPMPELLSPPPTAITTQPTAYLITIKVEHQLTGGITIKMYNTTALAVLYDKISARLRGRIANPLLGNEVAGENPAKRQNEVPEDFVFVCPNPFGRRIEINEPGIIGDLPHPNNTVTLHVLNG